MKPEKLIMGKSPKELGFSINSVSIDTTEGCSLRCSYCFCDTVANKLENNKLSIDAGKEIIDWLFSDDVSEDGIINIDWWGGEPFHNFDTLKTLSEYAISKQTDKKHVQFSATSNIISITEEKLNWCIENKLHPLFSIDGIGNRNRLRKLPNGNNSYDIIKDKLDFIYSKFTENDIPLNIRMTCDPTILNGFANDYIYFINKYKANVFSSCNFDTEWSQDNYDLYYKEFEKIIDYKIQLAIDNGYQLDFGKEFNDIVKSIILRQPPQKFSCGAGRTYFGISIEGALYYCHRHNKHNTLDKNWNDKEMCLGSIYEGINKPNLLDNVNKLTNYNYDSNTSLQYCKDCEIKEHCQGICHAVVYDNVGKIDSKFNKQCIINIINYRLAKLCIDIMINKGIMIDYINQNTKPNPEPDSCTCYNSKYIDKSEHLKHAAITSVRSDEENILIASRDIINNRLIELASGLPLGCLIYNVVEPLSIVNKSSELDLEEKLSILDITKLLVK